MRTHYLSRAPISKADCARCFSAAQPSLPLPPSCPGSWCTDIDQRAIYFRAVHVAKPLNPRVPLAYHQSLPQCARPLWYADNQVGRLHGMTGTPKHAKLPILRDWTADRLR